MFVTTLIAPPGRLEAGFATALRNAWGGGALRWLSPGEAVEFEIDAVPDTSGRARQDAHAMGVDLVVQPAEGRRKRLLLADMDSTVIAQECIDELAAMAGVGAEVSAITERAMAGELDFEGALRARVALLAGLDAAVIDRVWEERITFTPGGRTLVATMKAHGAHTALVSGGFTAFTARVAAALGFDEHRANELPVRDGRITGEVAEPILGRDAKVAALEALCARIGCDASEAMAVGDGANDLGMLHLAGAGVALHAKPAVAAAVERRIDFGDLTALLYLQGYGVDDFTG